MPRPRPKPRYRVGNPRSIPSGIHILTLRDGIQLFEDDPFIRPVDMLDEELAGLVEKGLVLEVSDG